jgi:hypothetical protein
MPGLTKGVLVKILESILRADDGDLTVTGFVGEGKDLPWVCETRVGPHTRRRFLFHVWTISHGGKSRAKEEYRIQAKLKVARQLTLKGGIPVLLGYYSERYDKTSTALGNDPPEGMEVFAAWDPVQHFKLGRSSSCQVRFETLYEASLVGVSVTSRRLADGSTERIVCFRPARLREYLRALQLGHVNVTTRSFDRQLGSVKG